MAIFSHLFISSLLSGLDIGVGFFSVLLTMFQASSSRKYILMSTFQMFQFDLPASLPSSQKMYDGGILDQVVLTGRCFKGYRWAKRDGVIG